MCSRAVFIFLCRTRGRRSEHRVSPEAHRGRLHPAAAQLCQQRPHRQSEECVAPLTNSCCVLAWVQQTDPWSVALQAAMDFCMNMNTKSNRRKLVRALFTVPRQRWSWALCLFTAGLKIVKQPPLEGFNLPSPPEGALSLTTSQTRADSLAGWIFCPSTLAWWPLSTPACPTWPRTSAPCWRETSGSM